jgi:predicted TIM-barrel fold metal-dependent hydrolase
LAFEIIDSNTVFGPWPMVRADMSIERLASALVNHGVTRALSLSTVGVLHNAGDGNAETLHLCAEQIILAPVATIDPRGYFGPAGNIARLAEQGFKMFRFFQKLQEWDFDHSGFHDLLDELDAPGVPVMVQGRDTGHPTALARNVAGRSNAFILDGISFENMAEAVSVMRKHQNIYVNTRELRVPGALRFLVDQIGSDRVVFGSGCLTSSLAASLNYVIESEVNDVDKAAILGGNMKRLLGG